MFFLDRFYDILLSVYLYNEKRGYTYLEQLLGAFQESFPAEKQIIASIAKHAGDERRHYALFQEYFREQNRAAFLVSSWCGYCDQMVSCIFGKTIDQLDPNAIVHEQQKFFQLCRLIMITEMRGMKQVRLILKNPLIKNRPELTKIFRVVERDEPSHCYPYQAWLRKHGQHEPSKKEYLADCFVHYSLMLVKLPLLYCNPFLRRINT